MDIQTQSQVINDPRDADQDIEYFTFIKYGKNIDTSILVNQPYIKKAVEQTTIAIDFFHMFSSYAEQFYITNDQACGPCQITNSNQLPILGIIYADDCFPSIPINKYKVAKGYQTRIKNGGGQLQLKFRRMNNDYSFVEMADMGAPGGYIIQFTIGYYYK